MATLSKTYPTVNSWTPWTISRNASWIVIFAAVNRPQFESYGCRQLHHGFTKTLINIWDTTQRSAGVLWWPLPSEGLEESCQEIQSNTEDKYSQKLHMHEVSNVVSALIKQPMSQIYVHESSTTVQSTVGWSQLANHMSALVLCCRGDVHEQTHAHTPTQIYE